MDVQNPKFAVAYVAEAVNDSDRSRHPCSGACADDLIVECEFGLAFENVEGIDVVRVRVWSYAESRAEAAVDDLELG